MEEVEENKMQGAFFDDFDAAFGSDNDVPELIIKKETKQPEITPLATQ